MPTGPTAQTQSQATADPARRASSARGGSQRDGRRRAARGDEEVARVVLLEAEGAHGLEAARGAGHVALEARIRDADAPVLGLLGEREHVLDDLLERRCRRHELLGRVVAQQLLQAR